MVGRSSHLPVLSNHIESLILVGIDRKIANYLQLIPILLLLRLKSSPIYNMVRPPDRKPSVARHRVSCFLLLFSGPPAEILLAFLPQISISFNGLVLCPPITKIKIPSNDAHIHFFVHPLNLLQLVDSFIRVFQTLKMNTIDGHFYAFFLLLCELEHCGQSTSAHG